MKLKQFRAVNARGNQTIPYISFIRKTGIATMNGAAVEAIGAKEGDLIGFFQDEERPSDWYIGRVNMSGDGFKLRHSKNNISLTFNCKALCATLLGSIDKTLGKGRFLVATEATDGVFAIITAAAKGGTGKY